MTGEATPLLVLGSGQRCGSTLVQRLLCSHPRVMIWGEHVGQLRPVLAAVQRLRLWTGGDGATGRDELACSGYQGFIANLTPERTHIDEACRAFVHTLFAKTAQQDGRPIWGFKEVRYELSDTLLLRELFPRLRVIQLVRDPRDVLRSLEDWEHHPGWTRDNTEAALRYWVTVAGSFVDSSTDPDLQRVILSIRYEDLVADPCRWTTRIAQHCDLDESALDKTVFEKQVHAAGSHGQITRRLREWSALPESLTSLLDDEDIRLVASAYGYDLS